MNAYRDAALTGGAPKNAMLASCGSSELTPLTLRLHQEMFLVRRFRLAPAVAAVIADHVFPTGGKR